MTISGGGALTYTCAKRLFLFIGMPDQPVLIEQLYRLRGTIFRLQVCLISLNSQNNCTDGEPLFSSTGMPN